MKNAKRPVALLLVMALLLSAAPLSAFAAEETIPGITVDDELHVNPVTCGDTVITGTGIPDSAITVTFPGNIEANGVVEVDGTWAVTVPEGVTVKCQDDIRVEQEVDIWFDPYSDAEIENLTNPHIYYAREGDTLQYTFFLKSDEDSGKYSVMTARWEIEIPSGLTYNGDITLDGCDISSTSYSKYANDCLYVYVGDLLYNELHKIVFTCTVASDLSSAGIIINSTLGNLNTGEEGYYSYEGYTYESSEAGEVANTRVATVSGDHKVTFDSKGGTAVASITTNCGVTITEPAEPTNGEYTFAGWYTDDTYSTKWDFATDLMPSNDMTLYARWIIKSAPPVIGTIVEGDDTVSGTGVPGASVVVTLPNGGGTVYTTVLGDGTWMANVPLGVELKEDDVVTATQTELNRDKSDPAEKTVIGKEKSAPPVIGTIVEGDETVSGTGVPGATVVVTFPDNSTATATVDGGGTWMANVPLGVELKEDDVVTATQTETGKTVSDAAEKTVIGKEKSAPPVIGTIVEGDETVSGTGVPGATVVVTFPDNSTATATVDGGGNWTVTVPTGVDLEEGDTVTAKQTETGKAVSDPAEQTVQAEYTVTFDTNGGSPVPAAQTVANGSAATQPNDPVKAGSVFTGWYSDSDLTTPWDFSTDVVTGDMTLYAGWGPATGVGKIVPPPTIDPVKDTDTIVTGTGIAGDEITVTFPSGETATATVGEDGKWTVNVPDGEELTAGDVIKATQTDPETDVTSDPAYTTVYSEDGDKNVPPPTIDPVKDTDTTVTGTGEPGDEITVTFPSGNTETTTVGEDGTWTVNVPEDEVLTAGDVITATQTDPETDVTSDPAATTVYKTEYTVTFNTNGGAPVPAAQTVGKDSPVTQPGDPAKAGSNFTGWYSDSDLTAAWDFSTDVVTGDMTLYAGWELVTPTPTLYTVTYNANGGTGSHSVTGIEAGSSYTVLTLTATGIIRSSYTFTGWNTAADGTGTAYSAGSAITVNSGVTLYAQWTPSGDNGNNNSGGGGGGNTYTVTYNANGGTGSYKDTGLSSGDSHTVLTLTATGISRDGYTFTGWNTKADGSGTAYDPKDSFKVTGSVTLYAQWEENLEAEENASKNTLDESNHFAYIIGYPDGTVKPEGNITRAEVATIFFRLLTQESRTELWSKTNSYPDVASAAWYNNAISTLTTGKIINGYPDGTFGPNASITRAEFATIATKFAKAEDIANASSTAAFSDISGHWAENSIKLAAQLGYVNGYGDGTFRPDEPITRAEVATMLNRVLNRHVESEDDLLTGMVTWQDNRQGAWYYFAVQEATNSHYYDRKADGINEIWTELRSAPNWVALEKPGSVARDVSY